MKIIPPGQAAPLAYDVATASKVTTLGVTKIYELIASKELQTCKVGKRRLILAESLIRLINEGSS